MIPQAATAMLGDCQDMSTAFAWARDLFWTSQIDPDDPDNFLDWPYPSELRRKVAELMRDLAHCFDVSEQAHRKQYKLTGTKTNIKVGSIGRGFRRVLTSVSVANPRRIRCASRGPSDWASCCPAPWSL